jgi:integrase
MASYTKRGKKWQVRLMIDGKYACKTFKTKAEAAAWAAQVETEIRQDEYQPKTKYTLIDALKKYAEIVTPTKRGERWEIIRLNAWVSLPFASRNLSEIDAPVLAKWRDDRLKQVKSSTVNREFNLLSSVFEYARREWKWIKTNPVRDVKRPIQPAHRDRLLNEAEINSILEALGHHEVYTFTKQQIIAKAVIFALETAMRRGEVIGLTWDNVFLDKRYVTLNKTKNGDARNVPLSSKAVSVLETLREFPKPFDVGEDVLSSLFRRACINANVENATYHDLRHSALTRIALSGKLTPYELARLSGHRDLNMILTYFNASAEDIASRLD